MIMSKNIQTCLNVHPRNTVRYLRRRYIGIFILRKMMYLLILSVLIMITGYMAEPLEPGNSRNITHPVKDMYVIHATVYEVGILTNKTDNKTDHYNTTGSQESVTFFQTNGTHMDFNGILKPLLTNVTAQSMVGVAPVGNTTSTGPWGLGSLGQFPVSPKIVSTDSSKTNKNYDMKVSSRFLRSIFRRDTSDSIPIKVVKGTAVIPPVLGLQSISLPPLLSLNNNFSGIPVPIPNTAVVNYAKVNTLVRTP